MASAKDDLRFLELKDTISQLNITISSQNELIKSLNQTIAGLNEQVEYLKKKLYGSSSEKRSKGGDVEGQLSLFDDIEVPTEEIEPEYIEISYKRERKPKPTLEDQFEKLPVREVTVDTLSEEEKICPECGTQMVPIGKEVIRTEIEFVRPKMERVIYYATTYECPKCKDTEDPQFVKDNGKPALIAGSYISESLAAYIIYQKYVQSVPLYRLEQDFKQYEALITRATMARNVIAIANEYFKPLFDYFHRKLLERNFIMMDESPVQVLKEPDRRPQSKSYFWITRTGEDGLPPIVLYRYTETRAGENAKDFLKGINPGFYLMADGFGGYNKLKNAKRCCCYAHIRRYFTEAIPKGHEKDFTHPAVQGVLYCNKLFEYERIYKEKNLSYMQRYKRRLKDEKPVVEAFLAWAEAQALKTSTSASLTKALNYVLNRKQFMFTYLEDGRCSLSNNNSENSVRPVTVGRKNWLFSDSQDGAEASMLCYTIIEMAKTYNLKIYDYILFLLSERPDKDMTDEGLDNLSPWSDGIGDRIDEFIKSRESR